MTPTPTALPDPAVFLRAAALVESGRDRFSCVALRRVLSIWDDTFCLTPEYLLYRHLYAPRSCLWPLDEGGVWWTFFPQTRRIRALRRTARIAQRMRDTSFRVAGFEGVANPS